MTVSSRTILAAAVAAVVLPLALWSFLPGKTQAQSATKLQNQLNGSQNNEKRLSASAATFAKLVRDISGDIALLQKRLDAVQADLDTARQQLSTTRTQLRSQRARLARLRGRLAKAKVVLAQRLVSGYENGNPDIIDVLFNAHGFADLLERAEFLKRFQNQDAAIIDAVKQAKRESESAAAKLAKLTRKRQQIASAYTKRRNALQSMQSAMDAKRAAYQRARQARLEALSHARANSTRLQHQLTKLLGAESNASNAGPGGPWAIPWAVVQCESGGQNLPPNWATASGYYQIIIPTWKGFGGPTAQAYQASRAVQDAIASKIWDGGAGANNWDCFRLLHTGHL
ncbi:MAG TPA: transglycosylase family protein [Solirubrobacteraceae bacterium]|nr:transglycosylase family protein [Solirubrobacteraceae bacterium]